uniref:BED-type domain-containing protein n=1 Tax=Ditylenchus dipsaci TaxID=166011 RepID=A0A915CT52_9BILA
MANLNAVSIHQFFAIHPDANGNLWAICYYCVRQIRMRHANHFGHLYAHLASCQQADLLQHALMSIQNPAPFAAINNLNAQLLNVNAQLVNAQAREAALQIQVQTMQLPLTFSEISSVLIKFIQMPESNNNSDLVGCFCM